MNHYLPNSAAPSALPRKSIITTRDEALIVRRKDVLLDTEVDKYPVLLKAKILRSIMEYYHDDSLTIGIDPGNRIGVSIIYIHNEIESFLESSIESTMKLITILLTGIVSKKKIVRIGDGNITMAERLAYMIVTKFKDCHVEIVDEHGTSLPQNTPTNRRGPRDRSSAKAIALRRGRRFESIIF